MFSWLFQTTNSDCFDIDQYTNIINYSYNIYNITKLVVL